MEKSSKRGKIPQQDWPSIIARYEAGETLASIARTYDCSPPAISYIVSRTKARNAAAETTADPAPVAAEPQLLKGASEASTNNIAAGDLLHGEPAASTAVSLDVPVAEPRLIEQPANPPQPLEPRLFADDPPQRPNPPANPSATPSANPASSDGVGPILRYGHAQRDETNPAGNGSAPRGSGLPEARRRMAIRVEPSTCHCLTGMAARTVLIRCRIMRRTPPVPAPETAFLHTQPGRNRLLANLRGRDRPAIIHRQSPQAFPRGKMPRRIGRRATCTPAHRIGLPRGSAARTVAPLSIRRCASGLPATLPPFSQLSTQPSITIPRRVALSCARRPIACCGPAPVRESSWSDSRRARRCRRAIKSASPCRYSGSAESLV